MIMQGCVISCGTVVFFHKSRNLSRSLLTNSNFYCAEDKQGGKRSECHLLETYRNFDFVQFCAIIWLRRKFFASKRSFPDILVKSAGVNQRSPD